MPIDTNIDELDEPDFTEDDQNESPPIDIVAYNELRSCADLYRMQMDGVLDVKPAFQRDIVWKGADQTRFIDSLIKQLPIPSMCLALDYKNDRWIVIDGLQRMTTIIRFLSGDDWTLSNLKDITKEIAGVNAAAIKNAKGPPLKGLFSRVQNVSLPINVLRCDFSKKSHMSYLFTIFHRLNAGGIKLNNQEIRNAIYGGSFNDLLIELDKHAAWRSINRMLPESNYRFVKQEIILRMFAFLENRKKYNGQIAKFLNDYMDDNKNIDAISIEAKRFQFTRAVSCLHRVFGENSPENRIPTSILESVLVGIATNIEHIESLEQNTLVQRYEEIRNNNQFTDAAVAEGTSKKDKVNSRFDIAIEIFSR